MSQKPSAAVPAAAFRAAAFRATAPAASDAVTSGTAVPAAAPRRPSFIYTAAVWLAAGLLLFGAGCGPVSEKDLQTDEDRFRYGSGSLRDNDGGLFGRPRSVEENLDPSQNTARNSAALAQVNPYLWQAALKTLATFPLASADTNSGVIITDWYALPAQPNTQYKINISILNTALRPEALQVSIFKQSRKDASAPWVSEATSEETTNQFKDTILSRARDLRIQATAVNPNAR